MIIFIPLEMTHFTWAIFAAYLGDFYSWLMGKCGSTVNMLHDSDASLMISRKSTL